MYQVDRAGEVDGERLLHEDRHPRLDAAPQQVGVGAGRSSHHHAVQTGLEHLVDRVGGGEPVGVRERPARRAVHVGDENLGDGLEVAQDPGVHLADPAGADESDPHAMCPLPGDAL